MSFSVTVAGSPVDGLIEVDYKGAGETELGEAEVQVKNTATNRAFSYGDEMIIQRDGSTVWTGYLEKKPPTGGRNLRLNLVARDKREELQFVEVHRPFYDMDTGEVITEMVNKQVSPRHPVVLFDGSDTNNWTTDTPVFELADIPAQNLNEYGSDLLFLYWGEGATGDYTLTFSDVDTDIDDGRLLWFETRFLFNNPGGYFTGEIELQDHAGNNYVWEMEVPSGVDFVKRRYPAEEATTSGSELSSDGTLEYRISIDGSLPEARAAVLDYARARPFGLTSRNTGVSTVDVQTTGRDIIRRFDGSLFETIAQLAIEDGAVSFVDEDDHLHYEPAGDVDAPESITYSSTRVTDVDANKDATDIVNKVIVQGAGDLQVNLKSSASIGFYGVSEREQPLVDKSIQNETELRAYGEGYLNENAWNDTDITFTIADSAYQNVQVGQTIYVKWDPQDLDEDMEVSSVKTDTVGKVAVGVTGSEA